MVNFGPRPYDKQYPGRAISPGGGSFGPIAPGTGANPIFELPLNKNGIIQSAFPETNIHLVADDLTSGNNWTSRVGSFVATVNGTPTVDVETPFYPDGGFAGTGYREAVKGFSAANYYELPYDAAHAVVAGGAGWDQFEIVFKTGDFAAQETILSRYIAALAKYNFRLYITTAGVLTAQMGCATSDATCTVQLDKHTYYNICVQIRTDINQIKIWSSGLDVSTSINGVGAISNNATGSFFIGQDGNVNEPALTTHIIEYMRTKTNFTPTNRAAAWEGFKDIRGGLHPAQYSNNNNGTSTEIVNGKLFAYGWGMHRISANGYLSEKNDFNNVILNSTFRQAALTNWTVTAAGSTTTAQDTVDADRFIEVGGNACKITTSGTDLGEIQQNVTLSTNSHCVLSVDWKAGQSGAVLFYKIQNTTTGNYYNGTGWQAGAIYVALGTTTTTRRRDQVNFLTEGSGTTFTIWLSNGSDANNTGRDLYVYHVQVQDNSLQIMHSRIITEGSATFGVRSRLGYTPTTFISNNIGHCVATVTYIYNDFASDGNNQQILSLNGGANWFLRHRRGTGANDTFDGTGFVSRTLAATVGSSRVMTVSWNSTTASRTVAIQGDGTTSGAFDGTWNLTDLLYIGNRGDGQDNLDSYVKGVMFYSF